MAPEQIRGTPAVSHKTDLYALGAVLYQMLTGKPPFEGNTAVVLMHCHMNEPPPRPSEKIQEIPRALDDLVVTLMAKQPTDRPWDAAAVEVILTGLRDKAERGAAIAMVWPAPGSAAAKSSRGDAGRRDPAGFHPAGSPEEEAPQGRDVRDAGVHDVRHPIPTGDGRIRFARAIPRGPRDRGAGPGPRGRRRIDRLSRLAPRPGDPLPQGRGPHGLDPSHRLADGPRRLLEPLDRRFPENPYHDQIAKWRDKILLDEAEGRATILASPIKTRLNDPNTNAERQFVMYNSVTTDASNRRDDLAAVKEWRKMAKVLKPDDPEERPWFLLALHRAEQLEAAIQDRRQYRPQAVGDRRRSLQHRPSQPGPHHPQQAGRAVRGLYRSGGHLPVRPRRPGPTGARAQAVRRGRSRSAGLAEARADPGAGGQAGRPGRRSPGTQGPARRSPGSSTVGPTPAEDPIPGLLASRTNILTANSVVNDWTLIDGLSPVR